MKDGLIRALRAALAFQPQAYLPMTLGGHTIGQVRRERAARLRAWPDVFKISDESIQLQPGGESALGVAFALVAQELAREGAVRGWRGETFAIRAQAGEPMFHIERAAVRFFGFTSEASHLNGHSGERMLIARRSRSKAIEPGMLDNLVAGGVPSAESAWQTLMRECGEEAGIPATLASQARPAGALRICRDTADGLNSELLYAYDLALPAGFSPRNADGEVSEFLSLDIRAVLERIARGELTAGAALVAADFALRRGALPDDSGEIRAAIDACRVPTPT